MISMKHRPVRTLGALALALSCAASTLGAGCAAPKQDDFKSEGGISPDPTGIISGSVLYVGPRPSCVYEDGKPTRVLGRVLLTLFQFDNPPPPEGRATSALNLKVMKGSELFAKSDCLPEGEPANPAERVTRTIEFFWPQIALGPKKGGDVVYQVRGFYDSDEDMNPFFSVKNLPTAGDIAGGAVVDVQDPAKGFLRIALPSVDKARNGFQRSGVIVALGNYVWLERPAFQLSAANRFLDSRLKVPGTIKASTGRPDATFSVYESWVQLCDDDRAGDCGPQLEQLDEATARDAFEAGNVQLDFSPERYAFISEPVDILTVVKNEDGTPAPDIAAPDGIPDPHPLLGGNAFAPWFTPIVIMTRAAATPAQAAVELKAGIPNVRLIGSTLLNPEGTGPAMRAQTGSLPIAVPPIAAVELDPLRTACRVPYVAPKNFTVAYENRFTYCHDLPTGVFGVSTIQGVAGGTRADESDPAVSDTGFVYNGGRLSGQAWTLPNDLGNPQQVGSDNVLPSQGPGQLFVVHDGEPDAAPIDCSRAIDPRPGSFGERAVTFKGICQPGESLLTENEVGFDGANCLPEDCCAGIMHLCGRPLCEYCTEETCPGTNLEGRFVRSGPTEIVEVTREGKSIPNCVPFELPTLCCGVPEE